MDKNKNNKFFEKSKITTVQFETYPYAVFILKIESLISEAASQESK